MPAAPAAVCDWARNCDLCGFGAGGRLIPADVAYLAIRSMFCRTIRPSSTIDGVGMRDRSAGCDMRSSRIECKEWDRIMHGLSQSLWGPGSRAPTRCSKTVGEHHPVSDFEWR